MSNPFISALSEEFDLFLQYKHALGYKYKAEENILHQLDKFICNQNIKERCLSKDIVLQWTEKKDYQSAKTHLALISVVRQFAIFLNSLGISAYIYPNNYRVRSEKIFVPYIYTRAELSQFFNVVDNLEYCKNSIKRHLVFPVLFRILLCCGLRLSEALHLTLNDVDLDNGILTITNGKFSKDRLVPMSKELTDYCRNYYQSMNFDYNTDALFLPNRYGEPYDIKSIYWSFRKFLRLANISHQGREKGPRIHDFRHTFAVNCLKNWVEQGRDINLMLPILSTYLGHSGITGTLGYLQLTADMYPHITKAVERDFGDIIPKARVEYANN